MLCICSVKSKKLFQFYFLTCRDKATSLFVIGFVCLTFPRLRHYPIRRLPYLSFCLSVCSSLSFFLFPRSRPTSATGSRSSLPVDRLPESGWTFCVASLFWKIEKKIKLVWCSILKKFDRIKDFFLLKRFVAYLKSIWVFKVTCFLIIYIIL